MDVKTLKSGEYLKYILSNVYLIEAIDITGLATEPFKSTYLNVILLNGIELYTCTQQNSIIFNLTLKSHSVVCLTPVKGSQIVLENISNNLTITISNIELHLSHSASRGC